MLDKNPLIQEHTVDTLDNIRCLICLIARLHTSSEPNCNCKDTAMGTYLALQCAEQAIEYEINRLQSSAPMNK